MVYEASLRLADLFPDQHILETEDYDFDLATYAQAGGCVAHLLDDAHNGLDAEYRGREDGVVRKLRTGWMEVQWRGKRFHALLFKYGGDCGTQRAMLVGPDERVLSDFFAAVCRYETEGEGRILEFRNGGFRADKALREGIASASLDRLTLTPEVRAALGEDVEGFFAAEETYRSLGVAWRRGVLLTGPPGNGKTHAIKSLVNRLGLPTLYVRSFSAYRRPLSETIRAVFARAREVAPCLLIMEDLDSLVPKEGLSVLLNELDGFASNRGILTVATTNHPDRLDPALSARPSRFDRVIRFELPDKKRRKAFLTEAATRRASEMAVTPEETKAVAKATEGFSFAFLQELELSATMAWLKQREAGAYGRHLLAAVGPLRAQTRREPPKELPEED